MVKSEASRKDIKRLLYADFLYPYLKKGIKILDLGTFDGETYKYLSTNKIHFTYYGIDMDEDILKKTKQDNLYLIIADLEGNFLPIRSKFDIIILTEVLEHLKSPSRLMEQINDLLSESGKVLISLPNEYNIFSRLRVLLGFGIDDYALKGKDKHLHFPTIFQSREFIRDYFDIIRIGYWSSSGGRLNFLLKIIPDDFLSFVCKFAPDYLSRGVIFLCSKKTDRPN